MVQRTNERKIKDYYYYLAVGVVIITFIANTLKARGKLLELKIKIQCQ